MSLLPLLLLLLLTPFQPKCSTAAAAVVAARGSQLLWSCYQLVPRSCSAQRPRSAEWCMGSTSPPAPSVHTAYNEAAATAAAACCYCSCCEPLLLPVAAALPLLPLRLPVLRHS